MDEKPRKLRAGEAFSKAWREKHGKDFELSAEQKEQFRKLGEEISERLKQTGEDLVASGLCDAPPNSYEDWIELAATVGIDDASSLTIRETVEAVEGWLLKKRTAIDRERKRQRAEQRLRDGIESGGIRPHRICRIAINRTPAATVASIDGTPYNINDTAATFIEAMTDAADWQSMSEFGCKSRHLDDLPDALKSLIERSPAKGCRLKPEAWPN